MSITAPIAISLGCPAITLVPLPLTISAAQTVFPPNIGAAFEVRAPNIVQPPGAIVSIGAAVAAAFLVQQPTIRTTTFGPPSRGAVRYSGVEAGKVVSP